MSYRLYRFGADQLLPFGDPNGLVAGGDVSSDAVAVASGAVHYSNGADVLPLGLHTIPYSGIYTEDVDDNVFALTGMVGQRQKLWQQHIGSSALFWKWARLLSCRWQRDKDQVDHARVECTFEAVGNWKTQTSNLYVRTGSGSRVVNQLGDAWGWETWFYYTASSTGTQTIRIEQADIGIDLSWSGSMTSGHQLLIDARTWSVTNNGADAYSGLTVNAGHTAQRWLLWPPGSSYTVTCTVSAGSGSFNFANYYEWI